MEGRAHWTDLRPGDAHGVEGVNVEDVEAAASIHQHLGEALLADDGVNDEQVASLMGTGIPIFRQVVITIVGAENDTPIRL